MLKVNCINPEIVSVLAYAGHGSKVLIADGNYPLAQKTGNAKKVYLGVSHGTPCVMDVLNSLLSVVAVEKAEVMCPEDMKEPEIFKQFRQSLDRIELHKLNRVEFYSACMQSSDLILAISTGETTTFANILLTIACA